MDIHVYIYILYHAVDFPIEKLANFNLPCLPQATTALEKSSLQYYRGLPGFPHHDIHHITITNYPTCLRLPAPRKSQFLVLENPCEKYWSNWKSSPNRDPKQTKNMKPPTKLAFFVLENPIKRSWKGKKVIWDVQTPKVSCTTFTLCPSLRCSFGGSQEGWS